VEAATLTVALAMPSAARWGSTADPTCHRVGSASLADGWGCGSVGSVVISSLSCPEVAFRSEGSGWALAESVGSSTPRLLVPVASGCCVDVSDASGCCVEVSDACGPGVEDWSDDWSSVADADVVECGSWPRPWSCSMMSSNCCSKLVRVSPDIGEGEAIK